MYELGGPTLSSLLTNMTIGNREAIDFPLKMMPFYNELENDISKLAVLIQKSAQVLDFFSNAGIVHGDINPSNICVDLSKDSLEILNVKFIDFGSYYIFDGSVSVNCVNPEYNPPEINR